MQITSGVESDGGPSEIFEGAVRVSQNHVLLQSYFEGPREDASNRSVEQTVRSYLVDVKSGHGARISESLPLIKVVGTDRYAAVYTDPYPAVEVRVFSSNGIGRTPPAYPRRPTH